MLEVIFPSKRIGINQRKLRLHHRGQYLTACGPKELEFERREHLSFIQKRHLPNQEKLQSQTLFSQPIEDPLLTGQDSHGLWQWWHTPIAFLMIGEERISMGLEWETPLIKPLK